MLEISERLTTSLPANSTSQIAWEERGTFQEDVKPISTSWIWSLFPLVSRLGQCPSHSLRTDLVPLYPLTATFLLPPIASVRPQTGCWGQRIWAVGVLPPHYSALSCPERCSCRCYRILGTRLCPPNKTYFTLSANNSYENLRAEREQAPWTTVGPDKVSL